jgi:hypothetical protein
MTTRAQAAGGEDSRAALWGYAKMRRCALPGLKRAP